MGMISKLAFTLSLASAACCWSTIADSDALYGKSTAFRSKAYALIDLDSQAMVASSCGLRGENWRVLVGKAVQRRIDAMATGVWPNPKDPAKLTALMEVAGDIENELQLTLSSMSQNDCETLRSTPAILSKLDALAQQSPAGAGARPVAPVTARRGLVYDCHFGQARHYQLDLTYGHERLMAKGVSYPFDKGSGLWSAGSDSDPSIGGAFAISSKGPAAPEISVNLDSGDDRYHGRVICKKVP